MCDPSVVKLEITYTLVRPLYMTIKLQLNGCNHLGNNKNYIHAKQDQA